MHDNLRTLDRARQSAFGGATRTLQEEAGAPKESDEESTPAFGYLRGLHDRGLVLELRLRDGNRLYFPYSWLGPFVYNPSAGILLRFTGDGITLVWIKGSNLDAPVNQNAINLTDRGLQRHRITFVREMEPEELRRAGEGEPTVDRIEIVELDTAEHVREWLKLHATVFLHPGLNTARQSPSP